MQVHIIIIHQMHVQDKLCNILYVTITRLITVKVVLMVPTTVPVPSTLVRLHLPLLGWITIVNLESLVGIWTTIE